MPSRKKVHRSHTARVSIAFNKKIGCRSIYDIINSDKLGFNTKVNYIRHHYTFYDSFQDMFHYENRKKNENFQMLDEIIRGIVEKRFDPSLIKELNSTMIAWRKEHPIVQEELLSDSDIDNEDEKQQETDLSEKEKEVIISRKTSDITKQQCIDMFRQDFPYLFSVLNNTALNKLAVNHYKSSLYIPTEKEWREARIIYKKVKNTDLTTIAGFVSYKRYKDIMHIYKIYASNSLDYYIKKESDKNFNKFTVAYKKFANKNFK